MAWGQCTCLSVISIVLLIIDPSSDGYVYLEDQKTLESHDHTTIELLWFILSLCGGTVGLLIILVNCCKVCEGGKDLSFYVCVDQVLTLFLTLAEDVVLLLVSLYMMYGTNLICDDEKDLERTVQNVHVSTTLLISSAVSLGATIIRALKLWEDTVYDHDEGACCCLGCFYAIAIVLSAVTFFCALHFYIDGGDGC